MSPFPPEPLNTASSGSIAGKWSAPVQPPHTHGGTDAPECTTCAPVQPTPEPDTGGEVEAVCTCPPDGFGHLADCALLVAVLDGVGAWKNHGDPVDEWPRDFDLSSLAGTLADAEDEYWTTYHRICEEQGESAAETIGNQFEAMARRILTGPELAGRLAEAVKAERERLDVALIYLRRLADRWSCNCGGPSPEGHHEMHCTSLYGHELRMHLRDVERDLARTAPLQDAEEVRE